MSNRGLFKKWWLKQHAKCLVPSHPLQPQAAPGCSSAWLKRFDSSNIYWRIMVMFALLSSQPNQWPLWQTILSQDCWLNKPTPMPTYLIFRLLFFRELYLVQGKCFFPQPDLYLQHVKYTTHGVASAGMCSGVWFVSVPHACNIKHCAVLMSWSTYRWRYALRLTGLLACVSAKEVTSKVRHPTKREVPIPGLPSPSLRLNKTLKKAGHCFCI